MNDLNSRLNENPLRDIHDLRKALCDLLSPLKDFTHGAGYNLGSAAAHYPPKIACMESWSRTLWGIGPLVAGGGEYAEIVNCLSILKMGTDPKSPHFWGICKDTDQRLVEMASVALCLIIAKSVFWDSLDKTEQDHLYKWLSVIQKCELPATNWHFFRVFVCLAFRELGLEINEQAEKESFDIIESCYNDEGWYSDGINGAYDLYNPMGFHFYGLVYAKFSHGRDPKRAALFIERAKTFASRYVLWFSDDGSVIPYGRSLTYRFASLSFFSACAFAGIEVIPWGMMKRIILQGFRWWFSNPILDNSGILSCGYGYQNLIMADHYNSPGSPYWGLKTFLVLALPENHPFWQSEETPLHINPQPFTDRIPGFIISRNADSQQKQCSQLLCSGGIPPFEMNHAAQKYSKFAYSSRFGFCVSHSAWSLEQAGGDSMLLLSDYNEEHWRERREVVDKYSGEDWISSIWEPWRNVRIHTVLCYAGIWHIRIHRIESGRILKTAEGAFAVRRYNGFDEALPLVNSAQKSSEAVSAFPWGASRIAALESSAGQERKGIIIVPAPNLNILYPSCVIPTLTGVVNKGVTYLISAVCAGDQDAVTENNLPFVKLYDDKAEITFDNGKKIIELFPLCIVKKG